MVKSCDMAEIDHNSVTLQPESLPLTISADGKCHTSDQLLRESVADESLDILEIIIDGQRLLGGKASGILGDDISYLSSSAEFTLEDFEPRPDGTCLARYRRNKPSPDTASDTSSES
jgi:hypothetical protein